MKNFKFTSKIILVFLLSLQIGCASVRNKQILGAMVVGATSGAVLGSQLKYDTKDKQEQTRNSIISAVVFALIAGGTMAWHYRKMEQVKVDISGRYSRYRLCDPKDMKLELADQLKMGESSEGMIFKVPEEKTGELAISLDDNTKWVYPVFRKRYLQPERDEMSVISSRYLWEIIKPGSFVTRSQNPQYFSQTETLNDK